MKDFLAISDYSPEEIQELLDLAIKLKKQYFETGNKPIFKGKVLGMIFQNAILAAAWVRANTNSLEFALLRYHR